MEIIESYFAMLITIVMLLIVPAVLFNQRTKTVEQNIESYEADVLAWELETQHKIPMEELSKDFTVTTYTDSWGVSAGTYVDEATNSYCINPVNTRYVRMVYGNLERWFILE